ncbi:MAG: hypothetical protein ACFFD4_10245 [Candidatus Odinarchaeota archaeon]
MIVVNRGITREMQEFTTFPWGGVVTGTELPLGCQKCVRGEKLVVFLTGYCNANCFYCPISLEKKNKDIFQANERKITVLDDIIDETRLCSATSASFTGGDPFLDVNRMLSVGELLKSYLDDFHIHVYTTGRNCTVEALEKTSSIIDELRFHPITREDFLGLQKAIDLVTSSGWTVGLEVPSLRDFHNRPVFKQSIELLSESINVSNNAAFININELEFSETNYRQLLKQGYGAKKGSDAVVEGSELSALTALKKLHQEYPEINVHYCPVATKDSVQLPNRLLRRAKNIALPSDLIVDDGAHKGLLIRGVIKFEADSDMDDIIGFRELLIEEFGIPKKMITVDHNRKQILTVPEFLEENSEEIKELTGMNLLIGMVEEYPTYDRLETSFIEF